MAKLIVKDKDGIQREVTKRAFDLVGKKRGYRIIGEVKSEGSNNSVQEAMERLKAEKAAKSAPEAPDEVEDEQAEEQAAPIERKKPGPKPKAKAE